MIGEIVLGPKTNPPSQVKVSRRCRSLLHAGSTSRVALATPVLVRVDGEPTAGVELPPYHGIYWPRQEHDVTVENPSAYAEARLLWSDDADITRPAFRPESSVLFADYAIPTVVGAETEIARACLLPWALPPSPSQLASPRMVGDYYLPSPEVRPQWKRSTVAIRNPGLANLTVRLYGMPVPYGDPAVVGVLLDSAVLAAGNSDCLDVVVDAYPALVLTYEQAAGVAQSVMIVWQLHTN